eukprot:3227433-Prymnesium_polylepis.1
MPVPAPAGGQWTCGAVMQAVQQVWPVETPDATLHAAGLAQSGTLRSVPLRPEADSRPSRWLPPRRPPCSKPLLSSQRDAGLLFACCRAHRPYQRQSIAFMLDRERSDEAELIGSRRVGRRPLQ